MKKLMIAAAIVCAAAMSQAAIVNWGLGSTAKVTFDGAALGAQSVQLFMVGINSADDVLIDTRNTSSFGTSTGKLTNSCSSNQTVKYTDTVAGGPVWSTEGGDLGREYYIVIKTTQGGKDYTYTSSNFASSGLSDTKPGTVEFTFSDTKTDVAGTKNAWVYASVPEPTSGLLLLLGMAGLALRRRRA